MLQEQPVAARPEVGRHDLLQRLLSSVGRLGRYPPQTIRDAVHVRVHAEGGLAKGVDEHAVGRLAPDAGEGQQGLHGVRDPAAVFVAQKAGHDDEAGGFLLAVLAALQQVIQLGFLGGGQGGDVGVAGENAGRDGRGLLLARPLGDDGGDKDFVGVAKFHRPTPVVGGSEGVHNGANVVRDDWGRALSLH